MYNVRSRAAFAGVTTGAAALLAVPVVALGQVPGVDQVVGGVNNAAQGVVQAAPAPPVRLPAPSAGPKPAASAPAPAPAASPPAPAASAPPTASTRSAPATASQGSGRSTSSAGALAAGGERSQADAGTSGVRAHPASDKAASQTDTQIADEPASAPRDASPTMLPFTGLQLAMLLLTGLAAVAAGSVIRRTARP
jgi:hypothetical protein